MKHTTQDVAGGPIFSESGRPDVAGVSTHRAVSAVASFLDVLDDACVSDAPLCGEFAEFLSGEVAPETPSLPAVDPIFRESLRRRLWRMHLLTQAPSSQGPH